MKHSLSAGQVFMFSVCLMASASFAATQEAKVTENFTGVPDNITISELGATRVESSNLSWASGSNDASKVIGEKLNLDTEGDTVAATISATSAADINAAITGESAPEGANGEIYLSAKINFVPSDELETFDASSDFKFALYAYEQEETTNLVIYNGENNIIDGITFEPGQFEKDVVVVMKKNGTDLQFKVTVEETPATCTGHEDGWFNAASASNISALNLQGTGSIDDIELGYYVSSGFTPGTSDGVKTQGSDTAIDLTQGQVDYLDSQLEGSSVEAITAKIATMSAEEFDNACLLNLDIMESDFSYSFDIKEVKREGGNVIVKVVLVRDNALNGGINGTLTLKGSADAEEYAEIQSATISDDNFSEGDETTITLPAGDNNFFKANIK